MDYEIKADVLDASFESAGVALAAEIAELREKFEAMRGGIDRAARAEKRPALGGAKSEAKPFVDLYLRKGIEAGLEQKGFTETTSSGADGGYAVPLQIDTMIQDTLRDISPIRKIANVVNVGTSNYRRLVTLSNVSSGWVTDATPRPNTATLQFGTVAPPMAELYANPNATQSMLDDVAFDLEGWLVEEIAREFARAEGAGYIIGNGTNMPSGFLDPTPAKAPTPQPDGPRPFGKLQYLATGIAGAFPTLVPSSATVPGTFPQDTILQLIHTLRPAYRQNASFVMNTTTLLAIRKMKDSYGDYVWQPSIVPGQPDTLFGYPVVDAQDMPSIAPGSFSIAFGDFKAGYLIADRFETRILRDPFTNKPYVNFYATKRVSGCIANSEAIKLLKFDVS